jgi:hypothetical protein
MDDYTQSAKFQSACYTHCKLTNVSAKSITIVGKIAEDLQLDLEMDESKLRGQLEKKFSNDKDCGHLLLCMQDSNSKHQSEF